ncbi:MAG: MATE family efflux transporter [Bacteroidales bacterium]
MYSNKSILNISYPIFLSLIAQNIVNVTDTAFLGRVGEVELGASAIAGVLYIAIYMLAFGFSQGSQILIGRRNGEKNFNSIGEIFIQGSLFLAMLGVVVFATIYSFGEMGLRSFLQSTDIADAATKFLNIRILGVLFVFPNVMYRAFFVGITRTKILTINAIIMSTVNIILDYALIFGNFGLPQMGIEGAALASVIAEASSAIFFTIYLFAKVDWKKYGFSLNIRLKPSVIRSMLDVSIFTMLQSFVSLATWFLFFAFVEQLGERPLAISNIVRSLYMLFFMPVMALGATANTMVSNAIGSGDDDQVVPIVYRIIKVSFYILIPAVVILSIFPEWFIKIYTTDASLIQETIAPMWVLASSTLFGSAGSILFNAISGTGNTRSSLFFEVITLIVYVAYMAFIILYLRSSVALCWTTELVYWFVLVVICWPYLISGKWRGRKI